MSNSSAIAPVVSPASSPVADYNGAPQNELPARAAQLLPVTIPVSAKRFCVVLVLAVFCLAAVNVATRQMLQVIDGDVYRGVREIAWRFDMDGENTVPAWFSSLLLFSCAAAAAAIWQIRKRTGGAFVLQWALLAGVFVYLSLDESAGLHEILIVPLRRRLGLSGILYFAWVVPGSVLVLGFFAYYFRFWWRLPSRVRALVFVAAAVYLSGALGMELMGGAIAESQGLESLTYTLVMTVEESLEMLGLVVFLYALCELIQQEAPNLTFRFPGAAADNRVAA